MSHYYHFLEIFCHVFPTSCFLKSCDHIDYFQRWHHGTYTPFLPALRSRTNVELDHVGFLPAFLSCLLVHLF